MKLLVGLGNPESKYKSTRHNVGKDFLNSYLSDHSKDLNWTHDKYLKSEISKPHSGLILVKPDGYMNEVGPIVKILINKLQIDLGDLFIIYDELDLTIGEYKLSNIKGSRIHNGIRSINSHIESDDYWHLRIGIRDPKIPGSVQKFGLDPKEYVLQKFSTHELDILHKMYTNDLYNQLISKISLVP